MTLGWAYLAHRFFGETPDHQPSSRLRNPATSVPDKLVGEVRPPYEAQSLSLSASPRLERTRGRAISSEAIAR